MNWMPSLTLFHSAPTAMPWRSTAPVKHVPILNSGGSFPAPAISGVRWPVGRHSSPRRTPSASGTAPGLNLLDRVQTGSPDSHVEGVHATVHIPATRTSFGTTPRSLDISAADGQRETGRNGLRKAVYRAHLDQRRLSMVGRPGFRTARLRSSRRGARGAMHSAVGPCCRPAPEAAAAPVLPVLRAVADLWMVRKS
jgi:hypothetical protein